MLHQILLGYTKCFMLISLLKLLDIEIDGTAAYSEGTYNFQKCNTPFINSALEVIYRSLLNIQVDHVSQ